MIPPVVATIALTVVQAIGPMVLDAAKSIGKDWLEARFNEAGQVVRVELGLAPVQTEQARTLAWEVYVQLVTRVAVVPMDDDVGFDREGLSSLYTLFTKVREAMIAAGPDSAVVKGAEGASVPAACAVMLNVTLRPFLAHWHRQLTLYEQAVAAKEAGQARPQWDSQAFRDDLRRLQEDLGEVARALEIALGIEGAASLMPRRQGG